MRTILLVFALIVFSSLLFAQQPVWQPAPGTITLNLWPHGAPGAPSNAGPETNSATPKNKIAGRQIILLGNVTNPTITLYPAKDNRTEQTVVVFPGGGYQILAIDLEGTEICDWLNRINVTCVLLKYRVPNTGPYPKSSAALQDAQRAIGMVRAHAGEWHINPDLIGVLGFSAGAHLAAALSTHFDKRLYDPVDDADKFSCRPDFALIIYPGYLALAEQNMAFNPDLHVTAQTPPTFLVQAEDDPVHVENSLLYYRALKDAGVPAEMHLYAKGGHGYGLRPTALPVTHWEDLAATWLQGLK
ncbi:MAG TPA: alpha/beta hydrolase [Terriglobales bacterium]|nr:alpha/beta hydrolase [Terriglobales bacterium]